MRTAPVLVALLLVLAGCGAGGSFGSSTSTDGNGDAPAAAGQSGTTAPSSSTLTMPTKTESTPSPRSLADSYDIETEGGDLPVDYSLVHARVAVMLNRTETDPPREVQIEPNSRMGIGTSRYPEFYRLVGIRIPEDRDRALTAAAYVARPETVTVNRLILNRTDYTERTLAHESVHVVQYRTGAFRQTSEGVVVGPPTTDDSLVQRSITEGVATYTESEYAERYGSGNATPTRTMGQRYRNGSGAVRFGLAPYYFGARYADGRVESPATVREIYRDPPRTTEELIHGLEPGSEPVANLDVEGTDGDGWEVVPGSPDTFGELFVRIVLGSALNESAAASGADGWAGDRRVAFRTTTADGRAVGYAWALTFDDRANATEFRTTFAAWRETRAGDGPVRTERVGEGTVLVYLGDETFVESADGNLEGETVTVRVENGSA